MIIIHPNFIIKTLRNQSSTTVQLVGAQQKFYLVLRTNPKLSTKLQITKKIFDQIRQRLGHAADSVDSLNQCLENTCNRTDTTPNHQIADKVSRRKSGLIRYESL